MQVAMSSNSFAIAKSATAMLKMKMKTLPTGFPVALCKTAIKSCDRHSNRSFLLLRIADFVVDAVDVVDVSVSEFVLFPPGVHLAFSGIVLMHREILVAVEDSFEAHQHSNEESNVWRSTTVQLSSLYSHVVQERCDRKAWFLFRQCCASLTESSSFLVLSTWRELSDDSRSSTSSLFLACPSP